MATEEEKHRAGGPGKAARKGHVDPEDSGNPPGKKQEGAGTGEQKASPQNQPRKNDTGDVRPG